MVVIAVASEGSRTVGHTSAMWSVSASSGAAMCLMVPSARSTVDFAERVAFALRSVLDFEVFEGGLARELRHVGCALIGDRVGAGLFSDCVGEHLGDVLGALVVVDEEGVEEALVAAADVLGGDELERDAEGAQVGGVGAELGGWQQHVEADTAPPGRPGWR
jgi:hypothetical protein